MRWRTRVPLVWANLTHDPRRLLVALGGIGFAVVLIFMETGFESALLDSAVAPLVGLDADLILVRKSHYALHCGEQFDRRQLEQVRACTEVAAACPLYVDLGNGLWQSSTCKGYPLRVLAFDPARPVFLSQEIRDQTAALEAANTGLFDVLSKPRYGLPRNPEQMVRTEGEFCNRSIRLVGTFALGTDFLSDGTLVMSTASFAHYFPHRVPGGDPLSRVDLGILRVRAGSDVRAVKEQLSRLLPDDVVSYTKAEFVDRELQFWSKAAPMGYIVFLGVVVGFVVGVIICYQVIYSDVADHMAEFATLKAMGYRRGFFAGLILKESLCLSVMSFLPGCLVAGLLYYWLALGTGLPLRLTIPRGALVFAITALMCVVSGALAMRKVFAADPADLY
jgi:putative ABC transport system permease protein